MNPLYQLIEEWKKFMKEEFMLFTRTSLSNNNYYMLVPRNRERSTITTEKGVLTAVGYHVTVYEELRKEVLDSTFHITISLIDENKNCYVARIYYNEYGTYLFDTIKDKEGNYVSFSDKGSLFKFAINSITPFVQRIQCLKQTYEKHYQSLHDELGQLNSDLVDADASSLRTKLLAYQQGLQNIIRHIRSNALFNKEYLGALKFYNQSLHDTENRLRLIPMMKIQEVHVVEDVADSQERAQSSQSRSTPKVLKVSSSATKPARKKVAVETTNEAKIVELKKRITALSCLKHIDPIDKVLQEYELQQQILGLLNKFNGRRAKTSSRSSNVDALLDTSIRCNQLLDEINRIVLDVFNDKDRAQVIDQQAMLVLLQQCTLKTDVLVELAVKNNCLSALKLLMQVRKDVQLGMKTKVDKRCPLEIAYHHGYLDMFQFLLDHKVSANIVCTNKQPILFHACMSGRAQEMEALLEAGADPLVVDSTGFSPLGALLMRSDKERINIPMAKVFLTYAPHAIEQLQGRKGTENIPLAYACQENCWDAVELLLEFGADPNNTRFDGLTPFAVCVYKKNFELFKFMVENSTIPIREGLSNALDVAVMSENELFIEYIINYSEKHQLNLSRPDMDEATKHCEKLRQFSAKLSSGRNLASFFYNRLISDDRNDDDATLMMMVRH